MPIAKKKQFAKEKIKSNFSDIHNVKCVNALKLIDMMADSNIPAGYWFIKMSEFSGSPNLKGVVENYMAEITQMFSTGRSICFAGNQGTGKTMSSICILKKALKKGFSTHYTTASDIMMAMTNYSNSWAVRSKLREADFLVIDELDPRFFNSDAQKELFSGIYENIFRYRAHNLLPTIICTNETDSLLNVFYGAGVQSIQSLNTQYLTTYPVTGKDYRKKI